MSLLLLIALITLPVQLYFWCLYVLVRETEIKTPKCSVCGDTGFVLHYPKRNVNCSCKIVELHNNDVIRTTAPCFDEKTGAPEAHIPDQPSFVLRDNSYLLNYQKILLFGNNK